MTIPNPDYILPDEEVKAKPTAGFISGRGVTPAAAAAQQEKYKDVTPGRIFEKVTNALEDRQARSFTRLAEDTFLEAARKYKESPNVQTKAAYESAYKDFIKSTDAYQKVTNKTYQTNKVPQDIVGKLPVEPKGFDPKRQYGTAGASTPGERAKIDGAPDYFIPNTLDNSRWNSNSFMNVNPSDPLSNIYTTGKYVEDTPVAFIANENGSIYQNGVGDPIDLDSYVNRVIAEYSNAGKMNELRGLLVKITNGTGELAGLNAAKSMSGSDFVGTDYYTRELIRRAAQGATIANIFKTGEKTKSKFLSLSDYLKSDNANTVLKNYIANGGAGTGSSFKTTSISRQVYTPEDLELNIDQFFQAYTGQGATKEDVEYLTKRLNEADPQKTVTTNNGNTSSSVTTGGVSSMEEQNMMREMALKDPNAEGYNKATAYLSYFEKALRAPIELGA